jgi:predicted transposase/invertase (TIGR01784 family)
MKLKTRSIISFDWAIKRLLRQKANFEVLEGFLSELLRRKITIKHIGESDGTPTSKDGKTNRVDILVEADEKEIVIIELQFDSIAEYYHRMLFGVSKAITDYMSTGDKYDKIRKVYSVNIVHYGLDGDDYIYHGFTNFKGLHTKNELQLTAAQQKLYSKTVVGEIYPEYFIISTKGFNDVAKDTLDEWIYYLKNNRIEDHFTAQGLDKAREVLLFENLSDEEKDAYLQAIDAKLVSDSAITTAQLEGEIRGKEIGREEGEAIGLEKGEHKKALTIAQKLLQKGMSIENVSDATGLIHEQITEIRDKMHSR